MNLADDERPDAALYQGARRPEASGEPTVWHQVREEVRAASSKHALPEDVYGSWSPTSAPNGQRVAFVSDRSGDPAIWLTDGARGEWRPLSGRVGRVLKVTWSPDGRWLAAETTATGSSRHEVWAVRPSGRDAHQLGGSAPATGVLGGGQYHGWTTGGHLLITETTGAGWSTASIVEPLTGHLKQVMTGRLLTLLDVTPGLEYALLRRGPRGHRRLLVADLASGGSRLLAAEDGQGSMDHGFLATDGRSVYCRSDIGLERAALVSHDLITGSMQILAQRANGELLDLSLAPQGDQIILVWTVGGGRSEVSVLDLASGDERTLEPLPRDVVDEVRVTPSGRELLLTAESWADPRGVWNVNLKTGSSRAISSVGGTTLHSSRGSSCPSVDIEDVTAPVLLELIARDGLEVSGWLYRPRARQPWPVMIHLHGGPEAQERPVYNSLFQSLVQAGVGVFALNYRGSSGFGRAFLHADDGEGRFGAINDVADCARHLIERGLADAGRLGLMGRSYGGYLVLAALVEYPALFSVGVDICGMADFATFFERTEPWIAAAAIGEYGHPVRDKDLLRRLSPIHRIERLRAPLLVVHGADDTNVPLGEAYQVVTALQRGGIEHEFLLFEGEGHDLLETVNRVAFVKKTVAWVRRHLLVDANVQRDTRGVG